MGLWVNAEAQHECQGGHNCNDDGGTVVDVVTGNTSLTVGGNDSLGLGFGGTRFDVAIAQCTGSVSSNWFFGIYSKQKLQEIYFCHAMNLIASGYREGGEWIICNKTDMSEMVGCPGPLQRMLAEKPPEPVATVDFAARRGEIQEQFADYQMQITDLVTKFEQREQRSRVYARQQQQQYEKIQQAEDARKHRIELIKQEFGKDEEQTTSTNN